MANSRADDARRWRERLTRQPSDRIAWHNLAAAEGDLGNAEQAEAAARKAISLGLAAPETRLVLARALQAQLKLDEAEKLFVAAIKLRPCYADAHRDLAQLTWMRTCDAEAALCWLRRDLQRCPDDAGLRSVEVTVLDFAGRPSEATAAAERGLAVAPGDVSLLRQLSKLYADTGEHEQALLVAQKAATYKPQDAGVRVTLCESLVGVGQYVEAEQLAGQLHAENPLNQYFLAMLASCWRLLGDPRYRMLCDYDALVGRQTLPTPAGWSSLSSFLSDLAAELHDLHRFVTHPLQQSVRGGSQLPLIAEQRQRPLIRALFKSIENAVQAYVDALGPGTDPMRSRNSGGAVFSGAWSVRLTSGGCHADHVHPQGWLSSACYIAVPAAIREQPGFSGWLRFGQPAFSAPDPLSAELRVRPEPGLLVLFPAYFWHGVEAFTSDQPRLTVAFDAVPS